MKVDKSKWKKATLGELFDIKRGGSPRPIQNYITNSPDGINWIKIGDATDSKYITSCKEKIKPEGMRKSRFVKKGDFLLSNSMSFGRPYILDIDGCIHDGWLVLSKKEEIDYLFFYYLLGSTYLYNEFSRKAKGAVVNNLNIDLVSSVEVSIPSIHEQTEIVAELDRIQGMIDAYKAQIADLDTLAQSIFLDTFGDPITNPKGWPMKKLSDTCKTSSGGTPSKANKEYYANGNIAWLRSGEVCKRYITETEIKISQLGLDNSSAKIFPTETVVMAMYGATAGQVGILKISMSTNQAICGIFPSSAYDSEFLYSLLFAMFDEIVAMAGGAAQANISQTIIKNLELPLPPLAIQELFATRVKSIEALKEKLWEQVADCELLMTERMQYYFS